MKEFFKLILNLFKKLKLSIKFVLLGFHLRISNDDCNKEDLISNENDDSKETNDQV